MNDQLVTEPSDKLGKQKINITYSQERALLLAIQCLQQVAL